jgi:hypothetical protein
MQDRKTRESGNKANESFKYGSQIVNFSIANLEFPQRKTIVTKCHQVSTTKQGINISVVERVSLTTGLVL